MEPPALHQRPQHGPARLTSQPGSEWIRTEVLELRILDDELWQAAKARHTELAHIFAATTQGVREALAKGSTPPAACLPAVRLLPGEIRQHLQGALRLPQPSPACILLEQPHD